MIRTLAILLFFSLLMKKNTWFQLNRRSPLLLLYKLISFNNNPCSLLPYSPLPLNGFTRQALHHALQGKSLDNQGEEYNRVGNGYNQFLFHSGIQ